MPSLSEQDNRHEDEEQYPALERLADSVAVLIENQQTIDAFKKFDR